MYYESNIFIKSKETLDGESGVKYIVHEMYAYRMTQIK